MVKVGVNSCTDITGFGVMGHLKSMIKGSGTGAQVRVADVPLLPGTKELLEQGAVPGGTFRNMNSVEDTVDWEESVTEEERLLLCDAQTSGGLLISVPSQRLNTLLSELKKAGVPTTAVVGEITHGPVGRIQVS